MKRAMTIAVAAALLATMFGGVASAASSSEPAPQRDELGRQDDGSAVDPQSVVRRCRYLFGEDELADVTAERCLQLWTRWCNAHSHARLCPPTEIPSSQCRATDAVIDKRCLPDRPTDRPLDRPTDRPSDRPADRPTDRPVIRPAEPPTTGGPIVGPPDTADLDRIRDRDSQDGDREANDVHFRSRRADL